MTRTAPHGAPQTGVPSPGKAARRARSLLLERLRARIAGIEAASIEASPGLTTPEERPAPVAAQDWSLGLPEIDRHLPRAGLAADGVHEIAPAAHGDMPAALGFAAALAVRRLVGTPADERPVLWCRLSAQSREWGRLYGHGLEALGLSRHRLLTVTLNKPDAIQWTLEEALKSAALAGVIADVGPGLDLTAVRRLMLAANQGRTPALLLFPAPPRGGTAARTRWVVAANPSVPPAFDDRAPGAPAWKVDLVRCRGGRPGEWFVEWSHATHRFALAAAVRGGTADPGDAGGTADQSAAGAGAGGRPRLAARSL
ncbi:MAG: ImuA family protein [Hyphomicrobiales bacterium]